MTGAGTGRKKAKGWMVMAALLGFLSKAPRADAAGLPVSDHCDGSRFFNPWHRESKTLLDVLKWQWTRDSRQWPEHRPEIRPVSVPERVGPGEAVFTFIGHATFLIQLPGLTLLTDPHWSQRASPLSWLGPRRVHAPAVDFELLPPIDYVLISHNHYDHLDLPTLKQLHARHKPRFLVPWGNGSLLSGAGIDNVTELDWWQEVRVDSGTELIFAPSQHWSSRSLFDRNKSLWGSYMIRSKNKNLYFAGDSGYGPHFAQIKERLGPAQVALLPIGAYEPRWFMGEHHMNPDDAVKAHLDLKAERTLAMHFGCFQLTDEAIDRPLHDLKIALEKYQVDPFSFDAAAPGASLRFAW
jgi:L-ascorbate metabolism protein UlaG (beta-lactamase superfamily)